MDEIGISLSRQDLLSATEVAAALRVERSTASMYMRRGVVPARKLGRQWYSPRPLLDNFLFDLFEPRSDRTLRFSPDELLTASAVAALLRVRTPTAMSYMRRGLIPAQKIGRLWYSPRAMLDEYLADLFDLTRR